MTNFNMVSGGNPHLRLRVPMATRIENETKLVNGAAMATMLSGHLGDSLSTSLLNLQKKYGLKGSTPTSGGAWTGWGLVRTVGRESEARYWLQSSTDYVSLGITWEAKDPRGLIDACELAACIVPTIVPVP